MKVKIKKPMSIIQKSGLTEFDINVINGRHVLTTEKPRFKQNLKPSEYEKIMANAVKEEKPAINETPRQARLATKEK